MENNRVLTALLNCWSELLAVLGCQGFPKTLQGLPEGKLNKAQQAGRLNLQQVSLRLKCASFVGYDLRFAGQKHPVFVNNILGVILKWTFSQPCCIRNRILK